MDQFDQDAPLKNVHPLHGPEVVLETTTITKAGDNTDAHVEPFEDGPTGLLEVCD